MSDNWNRPYWQPDDDSIDLNAATLPGRPFSGMGLLSGNSQPPALPAPSFDPNTMPSSPPLSFGGAEYGAGLLSNRPPSPAPQLQTPPTLAGILGQGGPVPSSDFSSLQFDSGPMPSSVPGLLGPFAGQGPGSGLPQPGLLSLPASSQGLRGLLASGDGMSDPNGPSSYGHADPSDWLQAQPQTYYPGDMTISDAGIGHVRTAEHNSGTVSKPDVAGHGTVGIGHKLTPADKGKVWTNDTIEAQFHSDLEGAQDAVRSLVRVPLTQNQFDMLTSLVFNVGRGDSKRGFLGSNVLRNLNDGDYNSAAREMLTFDHANGKIVKGLTDRRRAEATIFAGPDADLLPATRPPD